MTINEFRAWLDGFKEAIGEAPTPEQWAKVLQKLDEVREPLNILPQISPYLSPPSIPTYPNLPYGPVWCGPGRANTSALPGVLTALAANQTRLGPEFEAVWSENIDTLYQN